MGKEYSRCNYRDFSFVMIANEDKVSLNLSPTLYNVSLEPNQITIGEFGTNVSAFSLGLAIEYSMGNLMFTQVSMGQGAIFHAKCEQLK